jgi:hypothetical protein
VFGSVVFKPLMCANLTLIQNDEFFLRLLHLWVLIPSRMHGLAGNSYVVRDKRSISVTECEQPGDGKSKICPELA